MSNGFDEQRLFEKLRRIEALFAGAATEGERLAADAARERIRERLQALSGAEPALEHRFSLRDTWSRRIFVALLRRYGIEPYRYPGQRYTTVMARVTTRFVDETLWPEFQEIHKVLASYLDDVTNHVLTEMIHGDMSEAAVVSEPLQLGAAPAERAQAAGRADDLADDPADEPAGEPARKQGGARSPRPDTSPGTSRRKQRRR